MPSLFSRIATETQMHYECGAGSSTSTNQTSRPRLVTVRMPMFEHFAKCICVSRAIPRHQIWPALAHVAASSSSSGRCHGLDAGGANTDMLFVNGSSTGCSTYTLRSWTRRA